ncbi:MAG: protein-L-isoaspartate O-methyltransferase [Candidatus Hodarchaeota archaeon]
MDKSVKINENKRILLDSLVKNEILKDKRLYKAFLEVPLENFIPKKFMPYAKLYYDVPNVFYYDESNPKSYRTISAPHMITIMLQGLALEPSDDLLILGAKSGYISALAQKLAPKGEIIVLEANSDIAKVTSENLERLKLKNNITVIVKNPLHGMPELSPWQKILVTGAIKQSRIHPLLKQLDPNDGVLYAPIGEDFVQFYTQILRMNEEFYGKRVLQVRFTPLITQLELNDLELVTDFEELEIGEEKSKTYQSERIEIKYASKIFEEIQLQSDPEVIPVDIKQRDNVISHLEEIEINLKNLKKEGQIEECFSCVENIESNLEILKNYKKTFEIKLKKMQNILNQIRSYNIVRKDLENREVNDQSAIDKKIEIINRQISEINNLHEILRDEINRIKAL